MAKCGPKTERPLEDVRQRCYTVDSMTERKLAAIGGGNRSKGLREAARVAYDLLQKGELGNGRT